MIIFSNIDPDYRETRRDMIVKDKIVFNDFVKLKKATQPNDESDKEFYYLERKGIDSVAFVLFDEHRESIFGLVKQFRPSYGSFEIGAYTGSIGDKEGLSLEEIVIEEVKEEAGYTVDLSNVYKIGRFQSGMFTNERINLYLVDVTSCCRCDKEPEDLEEENIENLWLTEDEVFLLEDWKAQLVVSKVLN